MHFDHTFIQVKDRQFARSQQASTVGLPTASDFIGLLMILIAVLICSTIPSIKVCRLALHDGSNPSNI